MRTRTLRIGFAVGVLLTIAVVAGCPRQDAGWGDAKGLKVAVSFAPLYCFAANVGGPDATVKPILTAQGPHNPDEKLSDAKLVAGADVFFVNGLGLDGRIEKLSWKAGNPKLKVVSLGGKLDPKSLLANGDHDHHGHVHEGANDPHIWLGLDLAEQMVGTIRDTLKEADPAKAADYDRRAAEYAGKLHELKAYGDAKLKDKKERKFITFHESLSYFARTFGLTIAAVVQKTPGKDPTAKELDDLIKICAEGNVRVIATEPQYTAQGSADRLRKELEAKGIKDVVLVPIDPLETADPAELNPEWYEAKMRANIDALAGALK